MTLLKRGPRQCACQRGNGALAHVWRGPYLFLGATVLQKIALLVLMMYESDEESMMLSARSLQSVLHNDFGQLLDESAETVHERMTKVGGRSLRKTD